MSRAERDELYVKVAQAFELKGSGYFIDAVKAIVDWQEARHQRRLERQQEEIAARVALLRETDPARVPARRTAA